MFYSGRGFSVYKYRRGGLGGKDERGQISNLPAPPPGSEEAGRPCALLWVPDLATMQAPHHLGQKEVNPLYSASKAVLGIQVSLSGLGKPEY